MALPLTRYVYGTTRLGDESISFEDRVALARDAIGRGLALHTSDQYGDALRVLRAALDEDRTTIPPFIFKVGWNSAEQIRGQVRSQLDALGLDRLAIGQLCLGGEMAEAFAANGPELDEILAMKAEGLVGEFVVETWPWNSDLNLAGLRAGAAERLDAGLIFYLNPLQRFVSDDLWDELQTRGTTIVAMRTVAGGTPNPTGGYLADRAAQVRPIFERSGVVSWTEFCVRYALGYPQVVATVGATGRPVALAEFVTAAEDAIPLDPRIVAEIEGLQREWYESVDRHAEPWTM